MIKKITLILTVFLSQVSASACPYPGDPLNWILRYCAFISETDDEIVIQNSSCFEKAENDLKNKNECATKENYKTKVCKIISKNSKKYKTTRDCLQDNEVKPFFAGG